ncbi:MAG: YIP1 family protein [Acidimicrobiia bacterium]|nr:YIP1 family protein [Acidimicrobiia bacterium]MDH4308630.1 YIP1 family protein [Acidimicrobiia bacterium]
MKPILQQAWRAATLDRRAFGAWMFDSAANGDAALLVIAVAVIRWFTAVGLSFNVIGLISEVISTLASWVFLSAATWFVGTRLFDGSGDWQTVLRLHGLAYLPYALVVLTLLPIPLVGYIPLVITVWFLVAAVVATSVALSFGTKNAALSVLLGAAVVFVIRMLIGGTFGAVIQTIN